VGTQQRWVLLSAIFPFLIVSFLLLFVPVHSSYFSPFTLPVCLRFTLPSTPDLLKLESFYIESAMPF
jgi:hypothetical protein